VVGLFAQWQPAYADAGIATFPVHGADKRPAVSNYHQAGLPASRQWAAKFSEADALGFACGPRSRLTVLDIDAPDENLVADAFAKLGPSPVVIQTGSGKFHIWYRHAGELRSIRKRARQLGLTGPVDILGNGGFAVAPPSHTPKGDYRWLQGSLADLSSLPTMRLPVDAPANDSSISSEPMGEGERNDALFHACLGAARDAVSLAALLAFAHDLNAAGHWLSLSVDEVERAATSAWRYQIEGHNLVGKGRSVVLSGDELTVLRRNPDGMYLYTVLREKHWGRDFVMANKWREHLDCGAWSLPRFRAARNFLISTGLIVEIRPAKRGVGPALFQFSSPLAVSEGRRKRRV
jgi:hypothetical protein